MFIESVVAGLGTLANWQTYVAALLFLCLSIGPMLLVGWVAMQSGKAAGAIGCLSMLVVPFLQTFALVVFVLTLAPVMLGLSDNAAWAFPWQLTVENPWFVAKLVGKLLIAAVILGFIPLLGRLQSLHTLLLGSAALALVIAIIERSSPQVAARDVSMWPGFWFFAGLVVIGSALALLGMLLAGMVATAIDTRFEGLGQLVAFPVAATLGFIPLFIYAAWLGLNIRGT